MIYSSEIPIASIFNLQRVILAAVEVTRLSCLHRGPSSSPGPQDTAWPHPPPRAERRRLGLSSPVAATAIVLRRQPSPASPRTSAGSLSPPKPHQALMLTPQAAPSSPAAFRARPPCALHPRSPPHLLSPRWSSLPPVQTSSPCPTLDATSLSGPSTHPPPRRLAARTPHTRLHPSLKAQPPPCPMSSLSLLTLGRLLVLTVARSSKDGHGVHREPQAGGKRT